MIFCLNSVFFHPSNLLSASPDAVDSRKQTSRGIIRRSIPSKDDGAAVFQRNTRQVLRELGSGPAAQPSTLWLMQELPTNTRLAEREHIHPADAVLWGRRLARPPRTNTLWGLSFSILRCLCGSSPGPRPPSTVQGARALAPGQQAYAPGHNLLLCGRRNSFRFCPSYSSEDLRVTCTECARHCDCPKPASANLQAAGFHLDRFSQFLLVPVELEMFLC